MHLWLPYGDFERFNHEYLTPKFGADVCVLCLTPTFLFGGETTKRA